MNTTDGLTTVRRGASWTALAVVEAQEHPKDALKEATRAIGHLTQLRADAAATAGPAGWKDADPLLREKHAIRKIVDLLRREHGWWDRYNPADFGRYADDEQWELVETYTTEATRFLDHARTARDHATDASTRSMLRTKTWTILLTETPRRRCLMPTYEDPKRDADELAETARALAYATRFVDAPADTYEVLGALHLSFTRLQQSLGQLAAWHQSHREDAATDDGDRHAGNTHATKAAAWLSAAATAAGQAADTVMAAQGENGHIAWRPVRSTVLSEALKERAAALDPDPEPQSASIGERRGVRR